MKTINLFVYIIASLLISSCSNIKKENDKQFQHLEKASWVSIKSSDKSQPVERHEATFINIGHKMYLLGGRGIKPVSIYDAQKNTWTSGQKPPIEMHHFQAVVYDSMIYVAGALTGPYPDETPIPNIYIYDPKNDQWKVGDEIPEDRRRGSTGTVLYQNKIYLIAGIKNGHVGDNKSWFDVYDPTNRSWQTLPDAPRARDHFQAVVSNNELFMLAGRTTKAPNPWLNTVKEIDVYDFDAQKWSTLPNHLPTLRAGTMSIKYNDDLLVIGGESMIQEPAHAEVEALNTVSKEWTTYPPLLQGRHGTGLSLYKGNLYIASGCGKRGGEPELRTMEMLLTKKM